ncbi:MAG: prolipoprotein diacylglyceryl transferase [Phycisphaerae bacterium]|nr:prolipoprotein diacylglyceryl transferase [Phycisphaerae bacterium]
MNVLLAESYLHSLDSYAINFGGGIGLRWYGLAYVAGFLIAWWMTWSLARSRRCLVDPKSVSDMMIYIVLGVLVGGRIGYALFYDPQLFVGFTGSFPFWDLLAIHKGGMASHGGMIGVIVALLLFAVRHRLPLMHPIDIGAFIAPPGLFLGRLANFINGELWGREWSGRGEPPWWTVKYPTEVFDPESGIDLTPFRSSFGGDDSFQQRIVMETYAGNEQVVEVLQPQLTPYLPSQIFQAMSDGPILLLLLALVWLKPRKPGVVAGWFLIFYGGMRIVTELFRQPDEGVALMMGLSRGQQLSVIQVIAGIVIVLLCSMGRGKPVGGLIGPVRTMDRLPD